MVKEAPQWYGSPSYLPLPNFSTVPPQPSSHSRQLFISRWPSLARLTHWLQQVKNEIIQAPLEPILHNSVTRVRRIGFFMFLGHPIFAFIWTVWLPQPWENIWLRIAVSMVGLPLIFYTKPLALSEKAIQWIFSFAAWIQLPVFFSWMYLCNSGNTVWLASMVAMILIYYHSTDWRLATLGTATGGMFAWLLFLGIGPSVPSIDAYHAKVDAVVFAFAWAAALGLGFSSANLRREHLRHTLATVGIMAHELRTPLATMSLVGEAMVGLAKAQTSDTPNPQLGRLAQRLQVLVHNMNHQIDTQIVNARLLGLPNYKESIQAGPLIQEILTEYPYRSVQERECVVLQVRQDFVFDFSSALFAQVMSNLVKNALKALAAADAPVRRGDLLIEVGTWQNRGRITVTDRGIGIAAQFQPRIFDAFFSTDRGTGHGLGLAFCRRAVHDAHGSITVYSEVGKGATFTLNLPITRPL